MELEWKSNANLSAMHVGWCVAHYPHAINHCAPALLEAAEDLANVAKALAVPQHRFWEQLLTLSASNDFSGNLASRLITRLGLAPQRQQTILASALARIRQQFDLAYPKYTSEMSLRVGPLRLLWEGCGPGLLHFVCRLTEKDIVVENAEIVLVPPIIGGVGSAHLATNRVHMEAMLTNPVQGLPETLRLAWLLSQLDLERPVYSEHINMHRLHGLAGLALLPVILTAGQELELCRYDENQIEHAIESWRITTFDKPAATIAPIIASWWEVYQATRPAWPLALTGLDKMLA